MFEPAASAERVPAAQTRARRGASALEAGPVVFGEKTWKKKGGKSVNSLGSG